MSASIIRYGLCSGLLYVCMVSPVLAYLGAGLKTPGLANPHREAADCSVCHVAPEDKLKSWYTLPSTKRKLVSGANEVCLKCHTPGMDPMQQEMLRWMPLMFLVIFTALLGQGQVDLRGYELETTTYYVGAMAAFGADPEWRRVREASEVDGRVVERGCVLERADAQVARGDAGEHRERDVADHGRRDHGGGEFDAECEQVRARLNWWTNQTPNLHHAEVAGPFTWWKLNEQSKIGRPFASASCQPVIFSAMGFK